MIGFHRSGCEEYCLQAERWGQQVLSKCGTCLLIKYTMSYCRVLHSSSEMFLLTGTALSQPDVMLYSGDLYLLHFALEQPAATTRYMASVEIKETNFVLPTGFPATREQLMQVLQRLQAIYIRASYWEQSITSRSVSSVHGFQSSL